MKVFNLQVEVVEGCVTSVFLFNNEDTNVPIRITDTGGLTTRILQIMGYSNAPDQRKNRSLVLNTLNEALGVDTNKKPEYSYYLFGENRGSKIKTFFVNPYNAGEEDRFAADSQLLMTTITQIMEQLGECRHISDGLYGYAFEIPSEKERLTQDQKKKIHDEVMECVNEILEQHGIVDNYEGNMDYLYDDEDEC